MLPHNNFSAKQFYDAPRPVVTRRPSFWEPLHLSRVFLVKHMAVEMGLHAEYARWARHIKTLHTLKDR